MNQRPSIYPVHSPAINAALWLVQILVALVFLAAASGKLAGAPEMIAAFERIGLGQWFRYATGLIETAAALLLLVPRFVPVGAFLLAGTMFGAVATHLLLFRDSPLAAFVLLVLILVVLYGRRERLTRLIEGR